MVDLTFYSSKRNNTNSDIGPRTAAALTFLGNGDDSMVKELAQNSIDAMQDGTDKLIINIEQREISKSDIPDFDSFERMLKAMKDYWLVKGDQYKKFFDRVEKTLNDDKIKVLVFEDFNTSGLEGEDTDNNTFKNCVNDENVSGKKSEYSLGNHGIGKNAVFNYSKIYTVFYSSKNAKGEYKFKGVSKLGTFDYDGEKRDERLFYGEKVGENVNLISDLDSIPKVFRRDSVGLSQFVLFVDDMDGFIDNIKRSFLETYWYLFESSKLEVTINGNELNNTNFYSECERLYLDTNSKTSPLEFVKVYREHIPPLEKIIHKIGLVKLHLMEEPSDEDKFSGKIMFLRDGMKIKLFNKGVGGLPKQISGVMYCTEKHGNAILGAMEPHSHHDFFPQLLEEKTVLDAKGEYPKVEDGIKVLNELKQFIKEAVTEIKKKYITDVTEVPFIDELFSGVVDGVNSGGGVGKTVITKDESFNRKINKQEFSVKLSSDKKNSLVYADEPENVGFDEGGTGGGSGGSGGSGGGGKGMIPGKGRGGGQKKKGRNTGAVNSRFFFKEKSGNNNVYNVVLRSDKDLDNVDVEVTQYSDSGVSSKLEGEVISVSDSGSALSFQDNVISGISLIENEPLNLQLEIAEKFKSSLTIKLKK